MIYAVTVEVEAESAAAWEAYMLGHHIQEVVNTGCFLDAMFCRMERSAAGKARFCTSYTAVDKRSLDRYFAEFASALRDDHNRRFGGQVSASREVFEVVSRFAPTAHGTGE